MLIAQNPPSRASMKIRFKKNEPYWRNFACREEGTTETVWINLTVWNRSRNNNVPSLATFRTLRGSCLAKLRNLLSNEWLFISHNHYFIQPNYDLFELNIDVCEHYVFKRSLWEIGIKLAWFYRPLFRHNQSNDIFSRIFDWRPPSRPNLYKLACWAWPW